MAIPVVVGSSAGALSSTPRSDRSNEGTVILSPSRFHVRGYVAAVAFGILFQITSLSVLDFLPDLLQPVECAFGCVSVVGGKSCPMVRNTVGISGDEEQTHVFDSGACVLCSQAIHVRLELVPGRGSF